MRTVLISFLILFTTFCFGQNFPRPNITAPKGLSVNTFTGNLFYQRTDLTLRGVGFPIYGAFYYNAANKSLNEGYGYGWSFYYNMYYVDKGDAVLVFHGDAKSDSFHLSNGSYQSPEGVYDVLTKNVGVYVLTTKEGIKYSFSDASHKKLTRVAGPNNNFIDLSYQNGILTKLTNSSGRTMQLTWKNGSLESIYDNDMPAKKYIYTYDGEKRLASVTNPLNGKINYEYVNHDLVRLTDENKSPLVIQYDQSGAVRSINSCNSEIRLQIVPVGTSFYATSYQSIGIVPVILQRKSFVTQTSSAGSVVTVYTFDANGKLSSVTDADNETIQFKYDKNNNLVSVKDRKGLETKFTYDTKGNLLTGIDPMGYSITYTYEPVYNKITTIKDKRGHTTSFSYDNKGNLQSVVKPGSITESYGYNSDGTLKTLTNANGKITSYDYNASGDLIKVNYPIGAQQFEYSGSCCNLSKVTDANGNTLSMTYDLMNRVKTVTDSLNNTILYTYDAAGNLASETDPNGNVKYYGYDALNRLTSVSLPSSGTWRYEYDGADNLIKVTDANSHITRYNYDKKNRLIKETDPIGNSTMYAYDNNGNLISKTFPNSNIINYKYDDLNRLIEKTYPGNSDKYSYDAAGNLASAFNNNITYTFEYDNLNRLLKKNIPTWGKSLSYTYDNAGNRKTMTDPDGGTCNYDYDDNNHLKTLKNAFNLITAFEYDLGGRLTKQINANNTYTNYVYDNGGRLQGIENRRTNGDTISKFYYTFDKLGNRKTMQDKHGLNIYNYDSSYRLTGVQYASGESESFKIDATGNRTERTKNSLVTPYTYNSADQIKTAGTSSFSFDANGNTIQQNDSIQRAFSYDGENRLVQATINTKKAVQWLYDPLGDKVQKVDTNGVITKMIYDGDNLLAELNSSSSTTTKYTTALGIDSWISMNTGGADYFYQKDGLNSTTELTGISGQLVNDYNYDVYGNSLSQTVVVQNRILYTGRLLENDIELYDYRSRFYSSNIGRFLNSDTYPENPVSPLSLNKYSYVVNNPLKYIDPTGKNPLLIGGLLIHALRNCNNETPGFDPRNTTEGEDDGWQIQDQSKNGFHQRYWPFAYLLHLINGNYENYDRFKFTKLNSDGSSSEAIWDATDGRWLNSGEATGPSFNYFHPNGGLSTFLHITFDVIPHFFTPSIGLGYPDCGPPSTDGSNSGSLFTELVNFFIEIITSKDPNEIIGTSGYAEKQWISSKSQLPYQILFTNNDSLATAPAQRVVIYLPIDQKLDPNSLRLGDFGFGKFNFTVPANITTYSKRLDVRDSLGVYVDVTAGLDIPNRRAFWIFESIDPATGVSTSLPADAGFLPVNDSVTHKGEGYVNFTLQAAANAITGDTATATASIIFDQQQPLATNTWFNTIDAVAPASSVSVIPAMVDSVFAVSWTGSDDAGGSGIAYYDLYVSKNNGPFTLSQQKIDSTHTSFTGEKGATYKFYTLATDRTGNREAAKTTAEQTVTVIGGGLLVSPKVFLGGAYTASTGLMTDSLRAQGILPAAEPYRAMGFAAVSNTLSETARQGLFDSTGSQAITDWVWVELRSGATPSQIIATRSGLLRRDGSVVDMDGVSPLLFNGIAAGDYYLALRHRNHLGVMTATAISLNTTTATAVDFTVPATATWGTDARKAQSSVLVLWPGDLNGDRRVRYNGSANDKNVILSKAGLSTPNNVVLGYDRADANLDGKVRYNGAANDKNVILTVVGLATPNTIVTEQIPN